MLQQTLFFVLGLSSVVSRPDPFYRKGYTYVDQFDAFYKLQTELYFWSSAFLACEEEGATLFYPKMNDEWTVVKKLKLLMEVTPNVSNIFVGIHDDLGLGELITVDGLPTPTPILDRDEHLLEDQSTCVIMDVENGSYTLGTCAKYSMPIVCKKKVVEPCPTVDTGYVYEAQVKKCYKINQRKKTWLSAMKTCFLEGGILTVIGNSGEANIIREKTKNDSDYFVGFRRFDGQFFFTVTGRQIDDKCYVNWRNGYEDETQTDCGVVRSSDNTLYTGTRSCYQAAPFVCEMTPNI